MRALILLGVFARSISLFLTDSPLSWTCWDPVSGQALSVAVPFECSFEPERLRHCENQLEQFGE